MNIRNAFKITTAALALIGGMAAANAADLAVAPVEPAAPIPYAFSWTGFYVGANVGYGFAGDDRVGLTSDITGFLGDFGTLENSGVFGGGQAGYNYQFGNFVLGLEADIQASGVGDSVNGLSPTIASRAKSDINWFGTIRPRVGFAWDRALIYATGGVAFGGIDYQFDATDGALFVHGKDSDTRVGYTLGAGVEYAFTDNWTAKLEYQYVNFGEYKVTGPVVDGAGFATGENITTHATPDFQSVRIGINYKF